MPIPSPQKILIINIFGIGDVLFTTPLITNLRERFPDVRIDFLSNRRTAGMISRHPDIDKVHVYERDEFDALYQKSRFGFLKAWRGFVSDIRKEKYDWVFDLSLNRWFGFVCRRAGIPVRIGYNYKNRSPFLTHCLKLKGFEDRHVAQYYLDLLELVGIEPCPAAIYTEPSEDGRRWAQVCLKQQKVAGEGRPVAVFPGGGASWGRTAFEKRWPAANYAQLIDKLVENLACPIILMGDRDGQDRDVLEALHHPVIDMCGRTGLDQCLALLECCRLVVVNDGGPLHMAVAVGTPTVSVFGPVDPGVYGPFPGEGHRTVTLGLPCQPCYRRFRKADCQHLACLNDLSVDNVYRAVTAALEES